MNKPTKALAALIVEDMESDTQLIVRLLKKAGYDLAYEQVETAEQMRAALEKRTWDLVISDYKMPQFNGRAALQMLQSTGCDIPFIVISGTIGEETAVSMMKDGAHDYLVKGNLARLVPAVQRELEQADVRRKRRQAEKALAASESELRALFASMQDVVLVIDREGVYRKIAPTNPGLLFKPSAEMLGKNLREVFSAEQAGTFIDAIQQVLDTKQISQIEYGLLIGDRTVWFETSISPLDADSTLWVARDVSARKQAEKALAASETELRALVEQVPAVVYTESADTRETIYISPQVERMTGYTPAEWIKDLYLWKKITHPEDLPALLEEDERTTLTSKPFHAEYRILTRRGRTLWIHDEALLIKNQDETPLFWQGVMYDITERKQAEEAIRQRVAQLEMLYQSGLALSQLLNPKEIGQKILDLLEETLGWRHTRIRLYHPQNDSLELLDFNQPGLKDQMERREVVEHFQSLIPHSNQGVSGWVIQHGQPVRSGDVTHDPRYVEAYPGIQSGLYVPMKLGERTVGVISIEDNQPDAFSEADERLIVTLASQAASAFENARLFEETRQRVMELETINRISLVLRSVTKQNEMLSIVLDEALAILNTSHGSIELYNKTTDCLDQIILRGWMSTLTTAHPASEGIAGRVFTSGEIYISREFASDPLARPVARSQIPHGWGGVCLPIRTSQQTLGVMIVSMPSAHELNPNEIRLLAILSEMTGAALQRMQLHEQTIHHLEKLKALRAIDHAISNSRDIRLTLNVLVTHTISQLGVDAADVILLHPGSNLLELASGRGFQTLLLENINLGDSLAGRAIMEQRPLTTLEPESTLLYQNPNLAKFWKEEGFACYWCLPLVIKGEVKGALEVYCRRQFSPDAEWIEFLEALAGQAAIAIDTAQLFENLQRANMDLSLAYDATIEGWSRAMDLRDHETEGHTLRVTDLTMNLARAMRVSESQLTAIRRGALLHDIGKMGVPDAILLKEGDLTEEEWRLMRKHPELARDMLMPITYLNDALNIPYCHHEKWDGTGYPQGLKGNQIPLIARIFAVVDVWDALTNDRAYRVKWTKQKARRYIKEQSGKHFDPQVVDVFLKHVEKD